LAAAAVVEVQRLALAQLEGFHVMVVMAALVGLLALVLWGRVPAEVAELGAVMLVVTALEAKCAFGQSGDRHEKS
jgi:hypothetical protein